MGQLCRSMEGERLGRAGRYFFNDARQTSRDRLLSVIIISKR